VPVNTFLLLGLGITEFSLSAPYIPVVKQALRKVSRNDAETFAERVLKLESSAEIRDEIRQIKKDFPCLAD